MTNDRFTVVRIDSVPKPFWAIYDDEYDRKPALCYRDDDGERARRQAASWNEQSPEDADE